MSLQHLLIPFLVSYFNTYILKNSFLYLIHLFVCLNPFLLVLKQHKYSYIYALLYYYVLICKVCPFSKCTKPDVWNHFLPHLESLKYSKIFKNLFSEMQILRSSKSHLLFSFSGRYLPRAAWTPVACGRRGGWRPSSRGTSQGPGRSSPAAWSRQWTATSWTWGPRCCRRSSSTWRPTYRPLWPR